MIHRLTGFVLVVSLAAWARPAAAANPRDVPLGGRTATMGGAGTASGNDSAMPYLNPAGLALLPHDVFALSASVYGYAGRAVPGYFHPDGFAEPDAFVEEEHYDGQALLQLPDSIMYAIHFGGDQDSLRHTVALSLIIPDAERDNFNGRYVVRLPSIAGAQSEHRSTRYDAADYYFGPTYALRMGAWRLGASLFGLYSTESWAVSTSRIRQERNGSVLAHSGFDSNQTAVAFSIAPSLGAQASFGGFSAGVNLALPSIRITGQLDYGLDYSAVSGAVSTRIHQTINTATYRAGRPLGLNVGISYEVPRTFAVAADLFYHSTIGGAVEGDAVSYNTVLRTDEVARDHRRRAEIVGDVQDAFNISVGGEVWLGENLALRGGAFTNFGTDVLPPEGSEGSWIADRAGATLGLGYLAGSFDTTVGAVYQHGWGDYRVPNTDGTETVTVDVREHYLMLVVSGVVTMEGWL